MTTDTRTNEELNVIIAKWMGWEHYPATTVWSERYKINCETTESWRIGGLGSTEVKEDPTIYCTDYNALRAAEENLDINQEYNYGERLRELTGNTGPRGGHFTPNGHGCFQLAHASARQRAEALVACIEGGDR